MKEVNDSQERFKKQLQSCNELEVFLISLYNELENDQFFVFEVCFDFCIFEETRLIDISVFDGSPICGPILLKFVCLFVNRLCFHFVLLGILGKVSK